jgi:hypothetical protein
MAVERRFSLTYSAAFATAQVFVIFDAERSAVARPLSFCRLVTIYNTNLYSSESDLEAEQSRDQLRNLVEQLLESNQDISRRLRSLEELSESQSIQTKCFRNNSNDEMAEDDGGDASTTIPDRQVLGVPVANKVDQHMTSF